MITLKGTVGGSFKGEVRRGGKDGEVVAKIALQDNLICNAWFTNQNKLFSYLAVGTGSTTPSVADENLVSEVGSRKKSSGGGWTAFSRKVTGSNIEVVMYNEFAFSLGAISGNISELGLFPEMVGGNCWTRALIKDGNGNLATIPVTEQDLLIITYYITYLMPIEGAPYVVSMSINGIATDVTVTPYFLRPTAWAGYNLGNIIPQSNIGIGYNNIAIDTVNATSSGAGLDASGNSSSIYSATSSAVNGRIMQLSYSAPLSKFNFTFNEIYLGATNNSTNLLYAMICLKMDTPITKANNEVLDITVQQIWLPA